VSSTLSYRELLMERRKKIARLKLQVRTDRSRKIFHSEWYFIVALREVLGLDPCAARFYNVEESSR
jgi:hypothetical protein